MIEYEITNDATEPALPSTKVRWDESTEIVRDDFSGKVTVTVFPEGYWSD